MKWIAIIAGCCLAVGVLLTTSESQPPKKGSKSTTSNPPTPPNKSTAKSDTSTKGKDDTSKKAILASKDKDEAKQINPGVYKPSSTQDSSIKFAVEPKTLKKIPLKLTVKDQPLARVVRVHANPMYHVQAGKAFKHGILYTGKSHPHWSFCYWDLRYQCYCYWDPCVRGYYYWCQPDGCYYPVSHSPYSTYCWARPSNGQLPPPVDPQVPIATVPGGGPTDDDLPEPTPIEPTSVESALPTTLAPPPVRPE